MRPISTGGNGFAQGGGPASGLRAQSLGRAARRVLLMAVLAAASSGCVYRMSIVQGNFLEGKTIDQVKVGMTRAQVRYLLGTPMVPDSFDKERWDYLLYFKQGHLKTPQEWHAIVYFQDEKVSKVDRGTATDAALGGLQPAEKEEKAKEAPVAHFPKL
jgi:outer membrane protein assembly factor BamE